jgi:hypothetical protein
MPKVVAHIHNMLASAAEYTYGLRREIGVLSKTCDYIIDFLICQTN